MKVPLSPRLQVCCGFVAPGDRVADVGTDHGYLGIWLLQQGIARSVIASDIVPGPLEAARRNAVKFGLSAKMEFYLSDGVQKIPRNFDTLVCAGMGADTMISILSDAPWLQNSRYRLILQCQSKVPMLRRYLTETGWRIAEETVLRDGRFLYTVMEVYWQPEYPRLTTGQCYFPPALLKNPAKELPEYYLRTIANLKAILNGRGKDAPGELTEALAELEALAESPELNWLKEK